MGAWGARIFDDDTACDLRDEFSDLLAEGHSAEQATTTLEQRWAPASDAIDLEPVFWIALATSQYRLGQLMPEVRDKAVAIIDSGRDLQRFLDEPKVKAARIKVLDKLKGDLLGPPRPVRRPKPYQRVVTSWELGQVFRYRLASGRYCLFRVVSFHESKGGRLAQFEVLPVSSAGKGPLGLSLTSGLRNGDGKPMRITVLQAALETNLRIAATDLGTSFLAPWMLKWRLRRERREFPRASFMFIDKLDLNLKFMFGLD
ncbi:DUF4259 domain-containing protein [Mesorhizobium sp. NPDC059025]|uniref:DUF4259 domain-containing protein n=1 Tax=unclassified Mesorhizobium TaxID=325217 RepID=UPI0036BD7151